MPEWGLTLIIVLLSLGFPRAVALAWALEMTPEGARLTLASRSATSQADAPRRPPAFGIRTLLVAGALVVLGAALGAG